MNDSPALIAALHLLMAPSQVRLMREAPLPKDVQLLLRIAAKDEDAIRRAATISNRPRVQIEEAAQFFIEQVLWYPGADCYRVLGGTPKTSRAELKKNLSLLMVWLHPDKDRNDYRSAFIVRVTAAWNELKTLPHQPEAGTSSASNTASARGFRKNAMGLKKPHQVRSRAIALRSKRKPSVLRQLLLLFLGPLRR